MCKNNKSPNLHQILELHPKSFPSKSNLKIKLMKCLNPIQLISHLCLALLNLCHSPSNIRLDVQAIIATFMAKENDVD
jgi:hypothetical protein